MYRRTGTGKSEHRALGLRRAAAAVSVLSATVCDCRYRWHWASKIITKMFKPRGLVIAFSLLI